MSAKDPTPHPGLSLREGDAAGPAQLAIYRRMGATARIEAAFRLTELARHTAMAGIRARHPHYTPGQVTLALARVVLGDPLTRRVWPLEKLVEP